MGSVLGPADGRAAGNLAAAILGNLALHAEPQAVVSAEPVDLAYVSMLKHDAYVVVGAGERLGFPVVLRPEGPARRAMSPGSRGATSAG